MELEGKRKMGSRKRDTSRRIWNH